MRTVIGFLTFTLLLAAGCAADEPTGPDEATEPAAVVSEMPDAEYAVTGTHRAGRALLHSIPAAAADVAAAPVPEISVAPAVEATGEPWLADTAWATIVAVPDDEPRLETIAERVPTTNPSTPLALQVVAERPASPHDHTHSGSE